MKTPFTRYGALCHNVNNLKKKKISHRHLRSVAWELIPIFGPWSRRGLNPIKPVYDPDQPDGRLNLTASAFNQLAQYTSSPRRRGYCYAERFMDNSPTNQLADNQLADRQTRRQTNSPIHQLADRQTRRQSNSPTNQLADNKLADRPTRRQLNWPKKTNSPKLKLSPKSM